MEMEDCSQKTLSWHHRLSAAGGSSRGSRCELVNSSFRIPGWDAMEESKSRQRACNSVARPAGSVTRPETVAPPGRQNPEYFRAVTVLTKHVGFGQFLVARILSAVDSTLSKRAGVTR